MKNDKNFSEILKEESEKIMDSFEKKEQEHEDKKHGTFEVEVSTRFLNLRKNPGINSERIGYVPLGVYEITKTVEAEGSKKGWGLLSDNSGWISLDFAKRI